jgi:catechol 2,3-dioxygenase-like lactoylglutathione lyase family enzyme
MFSHMIVGARDFDEAKAFYDALLAPLGIACTWEDKEHGWLSYKRAGTAEIPDAQGFFVCRPTDGKPASVGNGVNIGFGAASRALVQAVHTAGMAHGGSNEGDVGPRPLYGPNWYGGYLRDPTGNKICICCNLPE